jgi:hypothetical protein
VFLVHEFSSKSLAAFGKNVSVTAPMTTTGTSSTRAMRFDVTGYVDDVTDIGELELPVAATSPWTTLP